MQVQHRVSLPTAYAFQLLLQQDHLVESHLCRLSALPVLYPVGVAPLILTGLKGKVFLCLVSIELNLLGFVICHKTQQQSSSQQVLVPTLQCFQTLSSFGEIIVMNIGLSSPLNQICAAGFKSLLCRFYSSL